MQNILSVQELSASYSKTGSPDFSPILHNVSIQVHKGELTCLCGLNGSGKSTLLSILAGLAKAPLHFSAKAGPRIGNSPIYQMKRKKCASLISYMVQTEEPAWDFSVKQTIAMGLYASKGQMPLLDPNRQIRLNQEISEQSEDEQRIKEIMELLGISNLSKRSVFSLSGGEMQKIRIARSLIQSSQFLILDEPCANLDFCYEEELLQILRSYAENKNIGILITIHNINVAARFAHKLCLLPKQKSVILGTVKECFTKENLSATFNKSMEVWSHPVWNCPQV